MKKIINGKLYDTDTATYIGNYEYGTPGDFTHFNETLYKKKTGELFIHGEGGPRSKYAKSCGNNSWCDGEAIIPERDFDVKGWVADHCDVDTYIELFGTVEE